MTEEQGGLERYDRQLRIEGWDQENLARARVVVVGVGATGCEVSKNLALMGIGRLILVDNDVIELSNLSRQMLFLDEDIGKPKAIVAADRLRRMNPLIVVEPYFEDVRNLGESIFEGADVIVSCLDNWPVRRWLNSLAVELDKPLVDVAIREAELRTLEEKKLDLERRISELESSYLKGLEELGNRLENMFKGFLRDFKIREIRMERLLKKEAELREELSKLREKEEAAEELERKVLQLRSELNMLEERKKRLEAEVKDLENKRAGLEKLIAEMRRAVVSP